MSKMTFSQTSTIDRAPRLSEFDVKLFSYNSSRSMLTTMKRFLIGTLWFSSLIQATPKEAMVDLLTAGNYVILAKSGISTITHSNITGDIGVSPIAATAMTGFALALDLESGAYMTDASLQVDGKAFGADNGGSTPADLTIAVLAMQNAYTDAANRVNFDDKRKGLGGGSLGGAYGGEFARLTPGVYTFTTAVVITGDIYFEGTGTAPGEGDTDVFIIQTTGVLSQIAYSKVHLSNGALASNIFWQVAGNAAIGVGAQMKGIFLIFTDVWFGATSSLEGRIFSQTATNLDQTTIRASSAITVPEVPEPPEPPTAPPVCQLACAAAMES
jgi:hypothetical protein